MIFFKHLIIKLGSPPGGGLGHQVVTRQARLRKNDHFLKAIAVGTAIFRWCKKWVGRARILSVRALRSKYCFLVPVHPGEVRPKLADTRPEPPSVREKRFFFRATNRREVIAKSALPKKVPPSVRAKKLRFFGTNPAEVMLSTLTFLPRGHQVQTHLMRQIIAVLQE